MQSAFRSCATGNGYCRLPHQQNACTNHDASSIVQAMSMSDMAYIKVSTFVLCAQGCTL